MTMACPRNDPRRGVTINTGAWSGPRDVPLAQPVPHGCDRSIHRRRDLVKRRSLARKSLQYSFVWCPARRVAVRSDRREVILPSPVRDSRGVNTCLATDLFERVTLREASF